MRDLDTTIGVDAVCSKAARGGPSRTNLQPCCASIPVCPPARDRIALHQTTNAGATPIPDFDAIIIGAGMSGLYQLYRLREQGFRVRVFEAGTDVGGTWYWNRYPGARFDFGELFLRLLVFEGVAAGMGVVGAFCRPAGDAALSQPCRRQVRPAPRYPVSQPGDGGGLRRGSRSWSITLEDGSRHSARFLITAIGPLSTPTLPRIEGRDSFRGASFHTARWPKEPVDFTGKRVAVIGTGATGVQTIQTIAETSRPSHRVSAHAELVRAAAQRQDRRRDASEDQGGLSRNVRPLPGDLCLLPAYAGPARRVRGFGRGARGVL